MITTSTSGRDGGESRAKWKRTRRLFPSKTVTGNRLPGAGETRRVNHTREIWPKKLNESKLPSQLDASYMVRVILWALKRTLLYQNISITRSLNLQICWHARACFTRIHFLRNLCNSISGRQKKKSHRVISDYLLGLMDSSGTKTSVRVTCAGGVSVWAGDFSSSVALRLGWELGGGAGWSEVNAGMGFGGMLAPDLLWRSLRVGFDCCLSLKGEKTIVILSNQL